MSRQQPIPQQWMNDLEVVQYLQDVVQLDGAIDEITAADNDPNLAVICKAKINEIISKLNKR